MNGLMLEKAVIDALNKQINTAKEKVVADAVVEFEKTVRQAVGEVAINLANYFSIEYGRDEIIVHVQIEPGEKS